MRSLRQWAVAGILAALLLGSCTSSPSTTTPSDEESSPANDLAFRDGTDQPLIDEPPATTLDADAPLIRFEAMWLCELQRRTFTTPDAVEQALQDALDETELDRVQYDTFRHRVNVEQELRDSVLFAYQETCVPR